MILPTNMLQRNRVNILIKEQRKVHTQEHHRHADIVRQDLNRVADQQVRVRQVVEDVVDEDHGDDGAARACFLVVVVELRAADCPDYELGQHARGRDREEGSSSDAVDYETLPDCYDDVTDLEDAVYY